MGAVPKPAKEEEVTESLKEVSVQPEVIKTAVQESNEEVEATGPCLVIENVSENVTSAQIRSSVEGFGSITKITLADGTARVW